MDLRFKNDAVFQIVGPSGSGKTYFVCMILQHSDKCFKTQIKRIYWLQGIEGEKGNTDMIRNKLKNVIYMNGFEKGWLDKPQQDDAIVIDDLFDESTREKNFNNLFTKISRHRGVTVFFLTQNMFHQGGQHRTRNLNVHYLVIFKNPRDTSVIDFIARQAFPTNKKFLVDAFHDAVKDKPHGYLLLDFTQSCPDEIRVRANIFDPRGIIVYKPTDYLTSL